MNASCVDGRVSTAVEEVAPACFSACPQPSNQTSACYLHCLFDTMIGNSSSGKRVGGMSPDDIVKPFVDAFAEPEAGGCPSAEW